MWDLVTASLNALYMPHDLRQSSSDTGRIQGSLFIVWYEELLMDSVQTSKTFHNLLSTSVLFWYGSPLLWEEEKIIIFLYFVHSDPPGWAFGIVNDLVFLLTFLEAPWFKPKLFHMVRSMCYQRNEVYNHYPTYLNSN